jgi:hypothetical protein
MENSQNSFSVPRWLLEMGCSGTWGNFLFHQRTISSENTKTCWPDKMFKKYGGDAVLIIKKTPALLVNLLN